MSQNTMTLEITFKESLLIVDSITSKLSKIEEILTSLGKDSDQIIELYSADKKALIDLQDRLIKQINKH